MHQHAKDVQGGIVSEVEYHASTVTQCAQLTTQLSDHGYMQETVGGGGGACCGGACSGCGGGGCSGGGAGS